MTRTVCSANDQLRKFLQLSTQLRRLVNQLRLPLRPPPPEVFEYFKTLSLEEQMAACSRLSFYRDFYAEAIEQEIQRGEIHYTWFAIRILRLVPPCDLFDYISEKDCIEIYDSSGIQVYRSFNFGEYTSYSLEEVLTYPWHELFIRDHKIMEAMHAVAGQIFSGQIRGPYQLEIPSHDCYEGLGECLKLTVDFGVVSPLYRNHQVSHFLATSRLRN